MEFIASCILVSAQPLAECLNDNYCICPWGYYYQHSNDICLPKPGFNHETMGPSGFKSMHDYSVQKNPS